MKKIVLLFWAIFASQAFVMAQHFEITPFGGYVFPGTWHASEGSLDINGGGQYGVILSLGASRVMDFDFIYNRSDVNTYPYLYGYSRGEVPVSINYWMVGGTKNFRVNPVVSPFIGFNLGGCVMSPKETDTDTYDNYNYWFFAMGLDAGVKVYFTKALGIRLQGQMLMPIQTSGYSFYYGGGYSGTSVYLTSTLVQWGFTGGLIFRIGEIK
jgi:hypothetical protein